MCLQDLGQQERDEKKAGNVRAVLPKELVARAEANARAIIANRNAERKLEQQNLDKLRTQNSECVGVRVSASCNCDVG